MPLALKDSVIYNNPSNIRQLTSTVVVSEKVLPVTGTGNRNVSATDIGYGNEFLQMCGSYNAGGIKRRKLSMFATRLH